MKNEFTKEQIELVIKDAYSIANLTKKLINSENYYSQCRIKKIVESYKINCSHFDNHHFQKKHKIVEKICPVCSDIFQTKEGDTHEKTYCSKKCCNSLDLGNRRTKETNLKRSLKLKYPPRPDVEKVCLFCQKHFMVKYSPRNKVNFCSTSCSSKKMWQSESYLRNHSNRVKKMICEKKFGWIGRGKLSFPEEVYKKYLDENGFKDKYFINYTVNRKDFGEDGCYFLDFYFPEYNFDLEIDGSQHNIPIRREHDIKRDEFLIKNKFIVYRIKWKPIHNENGKNYLKDQQSILLQKLTNFTK